MPSSCDCGSGLAYQNCCGPFHHRKAVAVTAEALMRSRYSAFCRQEADYLAATWDTSTCPSDLRFTDNRQHWQKLEIIGSTGSVGDQSGNVEFRAYFMEDGKPWCLHEHSRFIKHQGHWLYHDGATRITPVTTKIGQNTPCPCGSGKKFKHCCGTA